MALLLMSGPVFSTGPEEHARALQRAEEIKTSDPAEFTRILERLDAQGSELPPGQRQHLRYLQAWQLAYTGDYERAIPRLNEIIDETPDVALRFRAGATVVNSLAIATRNEEAFARLSDMLALLPQVTDKEARTQGIQAAAILYNLAGQYELGLTYAQTMLRENASPKAACIGEQLRLEALYKSGKLGAQEDFASGIAACDEAGETLWANLIRVDAAHRLLSESRTDDAIALLQEHYEEVRKTGYTRLVSAFDALLAEAFWQRNDLARAQQFALRAVDGSVRNEVTRPLVDGYGVLYRVAGAQGNYRAAFDLHQKFATADKGYLTEAGAKALAYQTVRQQVLAKKQQIDALNKQNQLLKLQQTVSRKSAETRGLYIALLMGVLGFIAMWAGLTKRSQLHFMKLARRDGLTGIFNRAHFADAAEAILTYCRKGEREACVVLIDLDDFKLVNDRHGHAAGDTVLRRAVQAMQAHLRSIDIIGRLGGEEFGIVLPDCDPKQGLELAERFRLAVADISSPQTGVGFPVSASFGVTSSRWSSYNLRQLILHADKALYAAKNRGRNRVEMFEEDGAETAERTIPESVAFDRRRA